MRHQPHHQDARQPPGSAKRPVREASTDSSAAWRGKKRRFPKCGKNSSDAVTGTKGTVGRPPPSCNTTATERERERGRGGESQRLEGDCCACKVPTLGAARQCAVGAQRQKRYCLMQLGRAKARAHVRVYKLYGYWASLQAMPVTSTLLWVQRWFISK